MIAPKPKFAVVVQCKEARSMDGTTVTAAGTKMLVVEESDGWVEATSTTYRAGATLPTRVKLWPTREKAEAFARRWEGHPWWTNPNGNFEILEVIPQYVQTVVGYEVKT